MAGCSSSEFHRENKNRPREMSSKKSVSMFRDIFQVKKKHHRDPRFDDLSGGFAQEKFEENYSFIKDIQAREKEVLQKQLSQATDSKKKEKLKLLLQRMKNKEASEKQKKEKQAKATEFREATLKTLQEGKRPYFLKKSTEKKQKLVEQYKKLKSSGQLDKYMARKRKKVVAKDRKRFK